MSEAELLDTANSLINNGFLQWVSLYSFLFGYLAAYYYVLRHMSVMIRIGAFVLITVGLAYTLIGYIGLGVTWERYFDARTYAIEQGLLPPHWTLDDVRSSRTYLQMSGYFT